MSTIVIKVKESGPQGPIGPTGLQILNGVVDPTTEGRDGDFYINTVSNYIFGPKAADVWPSGVPITAFSPAIAQPYFKFDTAAAWEVSQGEMAWNEDEETFDVGLNSAILQVGLEMLYHVENATGATITDGKAVMFQESVGPSGRGLVTLMDGSVPTNAAIFLGLATEEIPDNTTGKITHFGRVRGLNCSGADGAKPKLCFAAETWVDGDTIYVDPVNIGFITNVEPDSPLLNLPIGFVLNNNANTGTLFVRSTAHDAQHAWGDRVGGDYTDIEHDGTISLHGAAGIKTDSVQGKGIKFDLTTPDYGWQDMIGAIDTRGRVTDPDFNVYIGNVRQYQFNLNDEAFVNFHLMHDYAPGTDMYIHAHWSHNVAGVTTGSVTWRFDIAYAKGHDQAPYAVKTIDVTQAASTVQRQHMIAEIAFSNDGGDATHFDKALFEVDGLILVNCTLIANTMDGGATPFLHLIDVHYQTTGLPTKNKAPNFYT